jgi:rRNA processing protein Gar1
MGIQQNVVAGHALAPAERPGPDRRVVERRIVRIGDLLQDVLGTMQDVLGTMKVSDRIDM